MALHRNRDPGGCWRSLNAVRKRGVHLPPVVRLGALVCYRNFICFVTASWLLQEDLAEHTEISVNYCSAVL